MGYCDFLTELFEDGRVTLPEFAPLGEEELGAGDLVIAKYERIHRLEMPGAAPHFVPSAGRWAATRLFRACQFVVYRDVDEATVDEELGVAFDEDISPAVHYSVDVVFRFLPDVARFAASAAENDPLLIHLRAWAHEWPLSSVGISDTNNVSVDEFADDTSLMQLYVDRVIAANDKTRLLQSRVRDAVRASLGMFPALAQDMATTLSEYDVEEAN